jgi:hypothetical protein
MTNYLVGNAKRLFYIEDRFVNAALVNVSLMVLFGASVAPYQTSIQGIYLPVAVIGMFMLFKQAGGLLQPLLRSIDILLMAKVLLLLDVLEVATTALIPADPAVSAWVFSAMFAVQGTLAASFWIKYDVIVSKREHICYETYKVNDAFLTAAAALLGVLVTTVIQLFTTSYFVWHSLLIGVVFVANQVIWIKILQDEVSNDGKTTA